MSKRLVEGICSMDTGNSRTIGCMKITVGKDVEASGDHRGP